jgi:HlyD family secretion protein
MTRKDKLTLVVSALVVAALLSGGWYARNLPDNQEKSWTGLVDAVETQIAAKIGGRLSIVGAEEGEIVSAGQTVIELDRDTLLDELAHSEAALRQAEGRRDEISARKNQSEHDSERVAELYEQGSASEHEYVRTQNNRLALEGMLKAAEAAVQMNEATVERVKRDLEETRVTSPVGGRVMMRAYEPGEVVAPGASVLSVAQMDPIVIYAFVDEIGVAALRVGDGAEWRTAHGDTIRGAARIVSIIPEGQFATQKDKGRFKRDIKVYRVKLRAENGDETLKPGMTVDVVFDSKSSG